MKWKTKLTIIRKIIGRTTFWNGKYALPRFNFLRYTFKPKPIVKAKLPKTIPTNNLS